MKLTISSLNPRPQLISVWKFSARPGVRARNRKSWFQCGFTKAGCLLDAAARYPLGEPEVSGLCLDHGLLFPNWVMEELPTIRELSHGGSNRNGEYGPFYG